MKRIILLFVFIDLFLISAVAQKGKSTGTDTTSVNPVQKDSKIYIPSPEAFGFRYQPNDSSVYKKPPRFRLPGQYPDSLRERLLAERRHPLDNMPVIISPEYYSKMPVYKPDTTIDFKLKIRKFRGWQTPMNYKEREKK